MSANDVQVGGAHYKADEAMLARAADVGLEKVPEHWDMVHIHEMDYFQAQITKYVWRHKKKNGLEDLRKAHHVLAKYIEILEAVQDREGSQGLVQEDEEQAPPPAPTRRAATPVKHNRFRT